MSKASKQAVLNSSVEMIREYYEKDISIIKTE